VRKQGQEPSKFRTVQATEGDRVMQAHKLIHHIESLKEKHDELDKKIEDLYAHHANDFQLENLKKQKLKIKDEIQLNQTKLNRLI